MKLSRQLSRDCETCWDKTPPRTLRGDVREECAEQVLLRGDYPAQKSPWKTTGMLFLQPRKIVGSEGNANEQAEYQEAERRDRRTPRRKIFFPTDLFL